MAITQFSISLKVTAQNPPDANDIQVTNPGGETWPGHTTNSIGTPRSQSPEDHMLPS